MQQNIATFRYVHVSEHRRYKNKCKIVSTLANKKKYIEVQSKNHFFEAISQLAKKSVVGSIIYKILKNAHVLQSFNFLVFIIFRAMQIFFCLNLYILSIVINKNRWSCNHRAVCHSNDVIVMSFDI